MEPNLSCGDCHAAACEQNGKPYPKFCMTTGLDPALLEESLRCYDENQEDRRVAQIAAEVEREGYRQWPRVKEVLEFARRLGAKKVGVATCVGLLPETRILTKLLRAHRFEVVAVGCKTGVTPKSRLGIDYRENGPVGPIACNPILQAQILNEAKTDLNIVMGLCVGHDSLFYRYAQALTTTLVTKDRVTGHNPAAALYTAGTYYDDL